ncbi:hypothetical protein [Flexivirga sp.]|uniref:hypothetical protein n=1 Tax=Flexivirga sp. TaxID=1962927 RepID=UPI003F81C626
MNFLPRMERIVQLHRDRAIAIATALLAALALLAVTDVVGSMSWYGLAATLLAGVVVLADSDSFAGLLLLVAMALQWLTSGMAADSWWVIPAAWLVLVAHVTIALVASGPDQAPIDRTIVSVWLARTITVGLATTAVAVVALTIAPTNDRSLPYGAAFALGGLIVAVLVLIRLTGDSGATTRGAAPK